MIGHQLHVKYACREPITSDNFVTETISIVWRALPSWKGLFWLRSLWYYGYLPHSSYLYERSLLLPSSKHHHYPLGLCSPKRHYKIAYKQAKRVNSALYWPIHLVCVHFLTKEYLTVSWTVIAGFTVFFFHRSVSWKFSPCLWKMESKPRGSVTLSCWSNIYG